MTPQELMNLAKRGKCVVWLSGRHMPAAFLMSMQFRFVMSYLPKMKEYKPTCPAAQILHDMGEQAKKPYSPQVLQ
jgi:hypothetical protein